MSRPPAVRQLPRRFRAVAVLATLAVGLAGLLAGCASGPDPNAFVADRRLVLDDALMDRVSVGPIAMGRSEQAQPLTLRVQVTNLTDAPIAAHYRIEWQDEYDDPVAPDASVWIPISLAPNGTDAIDAQAPDGRATDFVLKLSAGLD